MQCVDKFIRAHPRIGLKVLLSPFAQMALLVSQLDDELIAGQLAGVVAAYIAQLIRQLGEGGVGVYHHRLHIAHAP